MSSLRDRHFQRLNGYRRSREYVEYARTVCGMSDETIRQMMGAQLGADVPEDLSALPSLFGARWQIDYAIYHEFLEILPPLNWRGGSFLMREFTFGSVTTKFTQEGETYWCEFVDWRACRG